MRYIKAIDDLLERIAALESDLLAVIVIEDGYTGVCGEYHTGDIIDHPAIIRPDYEKREAAQKDLKQIYENARWSSIRYAAGKALGTNKAELDAQAEKWIATLEGLKSAEAGSDEPLPEIQAQAYVDCQVLTDLMPKKPLPILPAGNEPDRLEATLRIIIVAFIVAIVLFMAFPDIFSWFN